MRRLAESIIVTGWRCGNQGHDSWMIMSHGVVERAVSPTIDWRPLDAMVQQEPDRQLVAFGRCQMQWRSPVVIGAVKQIAARDEPFELVDIVATGRLDGTECRV